MKFLGIEIPIDGLAVSIAAFALSPDETRVRNTIVIAGLHGFLHPYEVAHHESENHSAISHSVVKGLDHDNALVHFNDRRFNFGGQPMPHGSNLKIHGIHNVFSHDVSYFKYMNMRH